MSLKKLSLLIGILLVNLLFSQKKEELQKQSAELKKQIAAINKELAKAKDETKLSIAYLNNINKKIALREKVYTNTQKEKRFIEDDIYLRQLEINKLNRELKVLKEEYAKVLVNAYKNKGVQNKVTFILSSKNFGEALRRVQYLKKYGEYQDKKSAEISDKASQVKKTIALREKSKKEKENLLVKQNNELMTIAQERKARLERERLAKIEAEKEKKRIEEANRRAKEEAERAKRKAEEEERRLAEIVRKREEEERKAIEANNEAKRIATERAKREAEEKAKIAAKKAEEARATSTAVTKRIETEKKAVDEKVTAISAPTVVAGGNFAANRGKMSFPVSGGQVTQRFGRQPHPVYRGVVIESNGIKIAVKSGTSARSVFPGVVVNVMSTGGAKTVMVKHGEYFTIYSNLVSTNVSKNQNISAGTTIGVVGVDIDGTYSLDFQIWDKTTPVDPLGWINY